MKQINNVILAAYIFLIATSLLGARSRIQLLSVVPNSISAGSDNTLLKLNGKNFTSAAAAVWNNAAVLPTTFLSQNLLEATVPKANLTTPGLASIAVQQNQQTSQTLTVTIANPVPTLTSVSPAHALQNSASSVTITATGTGFTSASTVDWNGTALATTYGSATQLTATIPSSDFSTAGMDKITVVNAAPGGGTSGPVNFTVVASLVITTTSLPNGTVGTAYSATLTATGGITPYTWSITAGTLPAGLSLSTSSGVISGTPSAAISADGFTVTVTDSSGTLSLMKVRRR